MTPRTGRPTNDPKTERLEVRLSTMDSAKLEYCSQMTGKSKGEIIRIGIDKVYAELKAKEQD